MSSFRPFFLQSDEGRRFLTHHPCTGTCKGSVLYVHPFAEEMNKSRRMAAMQARRLAEIGYTVLQIDLYGCGDSSGDFRDARWEIWKQDLKLALDWLKTQNDLPVTLLGLRLGALLALDFANDADFPPERIIFWQPVQSGETYLAQFLRLRLANAMIAGKEKVSLQDLKRELASNGTLEIAGYELPHELFESIGRLKLEELGKTEIPHHWFETMPDENAELSPASSRIVSAWENRGMKVQVHKAKGEPFWSTQEITDCPDLIAKTTRIFSA
jgi:exosortase A-associated hydrolase 2